MPVIQFLSSKWHLFLQRSTKQGNSSYISNRCMLKYQYVVWPAAFLSESKGRQKLFFLKIRSLDSWLDLCLSVFPAVSTQGSQKPVHRPASSALQTAVSCVSHHQRHPVETFVQLWHHSHQTWKTFWRTSGEKRFPSQTDRSCITFQNIFSYSDDIPHLKWYLLIKQDLKPVDYLRMERSKAS